MERMTGTCLCGATTITAGPEAREVHVCHCGMCRRWTSAAFMGITMIRDSLTHGGPVRTRQSSDWAERAWCGACGSPLWYRVTAPGPYQGIHHVAAGLFDGAADFPLTVELCIDRKPSGFAFAGERKRYTEAELMDMFAPDRGETP